MGLLRGRRVRDGVEHLITLDDSGRMVPTDRAAPARAVAGLIDGPLDGPGPLRRAGLGLLVPGRHAEAVAFLERSLALADERFAVAVHIDLGDAHRCAGAPDAAGPHYRQALRLAEEHAPDLLSFCSPRPPPPRPRWRGRTIGGLTGWVDGRWTVPRDQRPGHGPSA